MDTMKAEREMESEALINELEKIYLSGDWRKDISKFNREKEIKEKLGALLL